MAGDEVSVAVEEENSDYESDPEDAKLSLTMRRRVASDDEMEEREDNPTSPCRNSGGGVSGGDSDGQGAADDYDVHEEDEVYYDEYEEELEVVVVNEREIGGEEARKTSENGGEGEETVEDVDEAVLKAMGDGEVEGEDGKEEKEVEPFSVPISGAFYMHDDRFQGGGGRGGRGGGRHRQAFGGKKLWESKDEKKWGHDKFDELNPHGRHYEQRRRSSKEFYRGRGKPRGAGRGYGRGSKVEEYSENINQNAAAKDVRGRGPRRYQPVMKNKGGIHPPQYKQSARSFDASLHSGSGRMAVSAGSANMEYEAATAKKVESNLSSASPPFYPSGAPSKEMRTEDHNKNIRPSVDPNIPMPISNAKLRGGNFIDSSGMKNLQINDDIISPSSTKATKNLNMQSSASSSLSHNQLAHSRAQGKVIAPQRPTVFRPTQASNQVNKVSPQAAKVYQRKTVQTQAKSPSQAPGQQLTQRPLVESQSSSPPKSGNGAVQGSGMASLVYGGGQVVGSGGNAGAGHGDPKMPGFFPVMQIGGQHPGGMGVPAVGMAFPGYVGQPNGLGKSEMTWLPMLASAASAMGATYCSPYLAVDGNYQTHPTGQTSPLPVPSKDNNLGKPYNELKPQQQSEVASEESSQRQSKPRRYSEMSFSQ